MPVQISIQLRKDNHVLKQNTYSISSGYKITLKAFSLTVNKHVSEISTYKIIFQQRKMEKKNFT